MQTTRTAQGQSVTPDFSYTENRELSWLAFEERILEEAADEDIPLLERLNFLSIFTRNLDEFFMVRMGKLAARAQETPKVRDNKSGMTPAEQLEAIYRTVSSLLQKRNRLYEEIRQKLREKGLSEPEIPGSGCCLPETSPASSLTYPPFHPRTPAWFQKDQPLKQQIRQKDRLLCYPFESIEPFLGLLEESAADPEVKAIRITLYRLAPDSQVIRLLCLAAANGKAVIALVELRARFDEINNLCWAEQLKKAGCRVICGPERLKCHAKLCLISFQNGSFLTQIGTGNYNEETTACYTDLCLLTADREIGRDALRFFQNMEPVQTVAGSSETGYFDALSLSYRRLLASPVSLKPTLLTLIDEEIRKGSKGHIRIKANALTERDLIDKLAEASQAGVKIHLFLRSICCLRPGIPGKTENITVTSIVGRFLEHSRIYCFGSGENCKLYLSSADLMGRNMSRRAELACPITDPDLQKQLLRLLELLERDNQKARRLTPDGTYQKIENGEPFDCQEWLLSHNLSEEEVVDLSKKDTFCHSA